MLNRLRIFSRSINSCWKRGTAPVKPNPFSKMPPTTNPSPPTLKLAKAGTTRIITLNRPDKMNALDLPMIKGIKEALLGWQDIENCRTVVIDSSSAPKAFCAGGDVVRLVGQSQASLADAQEFFAQEYSLNHLIGTYPKPIISILDGITMGGGVGLSVHGAHRVCTENSVFAMPETSIGFVPDVGASFVLSRLEGSLGTYLGLLAHRLTGIDLLYAGIATNYIPSVRIPDLMASLAGAPDIKNIDAFLEQFAGEETAPFSLQSRLADINKCFGASSIEEIRERLREIQEGGKSDRAAWAKQTLSTLDKQSPTSLALTLELIRRGATATLKTCLQTEFAVGMNLVTKSPSDFSLGVQHRLVRKEKSLPKWNKAPTNNLCASYFGIGRDCFIPWTNGKDYALSPHHVNCLPTTRILKAFVTQNRSLESISALKREYLRQHTLKIGLEQRLNDCFANHVVCRESDGEKEVTSKSINSLQVSSLTWKE